MPAEPNLDPNAHVWVAIDVVASALGITERRARQLEKSEAWTVSAGTRRGRRGQYPRQYLWPDIVRTYNKRKAST